MLRMLMTVAVAATLLASTHASAYAQASDMSEGEVRRIDKEAGKVTLRHGPLTNLDMPAMTMVFQVKDRAMLDQMKVGEKVRFRADKVDGAFTVMSVEPVK